MIISDPHKNIVGFSLAEWLIDSEPCPKSKVRVYLTSVYNALAKLMTEQKTAEDGEEEEDEEGGEEEEGDEEGETELQWSERVFTKTSYPYFSVNELGDVLLVSEFEESPNLFFHG